MADVKIQIYGIRTVEDFKMLLREGADKISITS